MTITLDDFRPRLAEPPTIIQQPPKISPHDHIVCLLCGWDGDVRSLRSNDGGA